MTSIENEIDPVSDRDIKKMEEEEDEEELPPPENSPWAVYLSGKWSTKLMNRNKKVFGFLILFEYLFQMVGYIAAANFYSDADRLTPCAYTGELSNPDNASAQFDIALLLIGTFHMVSWLRCALLATIMLLSLDLMKIWYITMISTIFGLIAYVVIFLSYFSEAGEMCA